MYCPVCGAWVEKGEEYCPECGYDVYCIDEEEGLLAPINNLIALNGTIGTHEANFSWKAKNPGIKC